MEMTKEQEIAFSFHLEALKSLRKFWSFVHRGRLQTDAATLINSLDDFFTSYEKAKSAYDDLVLRFPNAASVLFAFADFVEVIENDAGAAAEMRSRAEALVDGGDREAAHSDELSSKGGAAGAMDSLNKLSLLSAAV